MQDASLQWHSWQTVAHRGTRGKSGASAWLSKLPGPGSPWPQRQRQWRCGGTMMKSVIVVKSVGWGLASWNIHDISILKSHHAFFSHRTNLTGLVMRWILEHWRDLTCLKQGTTLQALLARVQSLPPSVQFYIVLQVNCSAQQVNLVNLTAVADWGTLWALEGIFPERFCHLDQAQYRFFLAFQDEDSLKLINIYQNYKLIGKIMMNHRIFGQPIFR